MGYEIKRSQDLWDDQPEEWNSLEKVFGQEDREFGFGYMKLERPVDVQVEELADDQAQEFCTHN